MRFVRKVDKPYRYKTLSERMQPHPLWYGLGCFYVVAVALVSYGLAMGLLRLNQTRHWFVIPQELILVAPLPRLGWRPYLLVDLLLTVAFFLALMAVSAFVYVVLARVFGASPYLPIETQKK